MLNWRPIQHSTLNIQHFSIPVVLAKIPLVPPPFASGGLPPILPPMWIVVIAKLLIQLLAAPRYGWFGDELYFLACAEHLDWGYVDQPPLWPFIMWIVRHTLGTSVFAIHVVPALAGAAKVLLA